MAQGAQAADGLSGPASPAVRAWFASDVTLGCVDPDGHDRPCRADSSPHYQTFYGDADGGSGQPDAVILVTYLNDPTGNAEQFAVAAFRQTASGTYRFVKTFPGAASNGPAAGSTVRFGGGRATWDAVRTPPYGARAVSSTRQHVSISLR